MVSFTLVLEGVLYVETSGEVLGRGSPLEFENDDLSCTFTSFASSIPYYPALRNRGVSPTIYEGSE